jgi:DNA-binding response OmpR family regulator
MPRILVVDNDASMRAVVRKRLEDSYNVLETDHSDVALAMTAECRPDALLLGSSVPETFGIQLRRTLTSLSDPREIPIFAIGKKPKGRAKDFCRVPGAVEYFDKPVDFKRMKARLNAVLQSKRPERRREVRIHLSTALKLRGMDMHGVCFEHETVTENVSQNGFFCGCAAALEKNAIVEVFMGKKGSHRVGTARTMRSELQNSANPRYGFRFEAKDSLWILG